MCIRDRLGGCELNFSSDIDLIFAWPENGSTRGGRRELDNAQFFTRLGQRLIKALDQPTQDGFVYRVDMRLSLIHILSRPTLIAMFPDWIWYSPGIITRSLYDRVMDGDEL